MTRCSRSSPPRRPRPGRARPRRGFTLVELMVVVVIPALLIAFLLPAINSAVRSGRNASVQAEISQMAAAIAQFKTQYGVYPPSRLYVNESGDYSAATLVAQSNKVLTPAQAQALTQRSVSYLRRIWPRMNISTTGSTASANFFYDFNGNGVNDDVTNPGHPPFILQGCECLVFFLGGVPQPTDTVGVYAAGGFAKDPTNPMKNAVAAANRSSPLYEFRPGRLQDPDGNGFPAYLDGLGGGTPQPFAYFSAYEGQGYDPDDNNYLDADDTGLYPNGVYGGFQTSNAATPNIVYTTTTHPPIVASQSPNPYTNESPIPIAASGDIDPTSSRPRDYINKQSFQLFSAGGDNNFGIGGQFSTTPGQEALPFNELANQSATGNQYDVSIRRRERDNLTNFKNGTLE